MFALALSLALTTAAPSQPDLLVLNADGQAAGVNKEARALLSTTLTRALDGRRGRQAVSVLDLQAIVEVEAIKQATDCADDTSCLAELGNALGATSLVSHRVSQLGEQLLWHVTLLDVQTGAALARGDVEAADVGGLIAQTDALATALLPPSAWHEGLWWTGVGAVGLGVIGTAGFGAWTVVIDNTLRAPPSKEAQAEAFAAAGVAPWAMVGAAGVAVVGVGVLLTSLAVE